MAQSDSFYQEVMEHCRTYNSRLMTERRARLPYLDSQTKVAQKDCSLWFDKRHRGPGLKPNQVYSYPAKRWKKRPRFNPILEAPYDSVSVASGYNTRPRRPVKMSSYNEEYLEAHLINENSNDSNSLSVLNASLMDGDNEMLENDSVGAVGSHMDNDDDEDFDEEYDAGRAKKRSKRSARGGASTRSKKLDTSDEKDRPYHCMYCGKRYKNKAGLQYHLQHIHRDEMEAEDEYKPGTGGGSVASPATTSSIHQDDNSNPAVSNYQSSSRSAAAAQKQEEMNADTSETGSMDTSSNQQSNADNESSSTSQRAKRSKTGGEKKRQSNDYCDFCLGDAFENKKTGISEQLVSCSDCGRSAHPTCLQFTAIMTANVKKYAWQCIECKSCHVCGTSDNDDQLLFCDDCDRGYHMYCLTPRMEQPPEGIWICSLCEADKKAREAAASKVTLNL